MSGGEQQYIKEAFDTNWIAPLGPNVDAFEREAENYLGVKGAVAVSSGTAAIHLALALLEIKRGDIVFCSSLTFVASANPILYLGAKPVFIDSEPETWNMSPRALEKALIDSATAGILPKAVIVVNLYGQSAKMDEIQALCNAYQIPIIEDAAESLGAQYRNQHSGTFGEFGIFSFNGNKIITTSGGGMLVSNNAHAIKKARFLAAQAKDQAPFYQHSQLGYNYRLSNILAGIGRAQLPLLEDRVHRRRKIFQTYFEHINKYEGITFMPEPSEMLSTRWLTVMTIDEQKLGVTSQFLLNSLNKENIEARPVWKPLHLQPLFKDCSYYAHSEEESISDILFTNGICLPSGSNLTNEEQETVIECIRKAIEVTGVSDQGVTLYG
ncbi:DegT/DnrJ/EryC1/StrS family aminotransferase [Alkalihalobacillus trypoxylicola]|uniref:Pyridoxal phosphate-dependent aminotransferase n=1 Tax=Alkalihalobacillus trypoxylicola TaxID=519424 RepID=A0A161PYT2_9BACI|nr:aminotransferase class I/II-fold pyridoxal phosphate-dependent enzyme [Alkalihalobacillus trypoxylicola]KYG27754.1 pyridoxal phosphate-dependent aminotransferase [Alkalihalobacillus trypoxylicola]